ncbi:hypothetical protein NKH77_25730 [Streptomyces sp. M19]
MHADVAASSDSILLMLGLNRLGQGGVIALRGLPYGLTFSADSGTRPALVVCAALGTRFAPETLGTRSVPDSRDSFRSRDSFGDRFSGRR